MSFSSDEVNFLVYRYLQESGKLDEFHFKLNLVEFHQVHLWCYSSFTVNISLKKNS